MHGNTNKQNAKKDNPKSSFLHIRVRPEDKARWVKQAQKHDMKLAAWVEMKLDN